MKLVGFGCSWMYGSELLDPELNEQARNALPGMNLWKENQEYREQNSFLGLLGDNLNLSEPGNTLQGMFNTFMCHDFDQDDLVIIALTDSSRQSWYNNETHKFEHSSWIRWDEESILYPMLKQHIVYSSCDELDKITHKSITTSMINTCKAQNLKYVIFNALPNPNTVRDPNFFWPGHSMKEELQAQQQKGGKNYFHPGQHPNETGHQWIAGRLKEVIDSLYPNLL